MTVEYGFFTGKVLCASNIVTNIQNNRYNNRGGFGKTK
jgi:hypothetical protein